MTEVPDVIALLPMKGHSERVAGKNLRPLGGRPLYHWVMQALLETQSITEVVVDTDSEEIGADVSASFPEVSLRERPVDLIGDLVPMHDIVARFVAEHPRGDLFLQTHATNPLLRSTTLERGIAAYAGEGPHDSLMSVTEWRTRLYLPDGRPLNHDPAILLRTQDLQPVYEENSNFYIASREVIMTTGRRVGERPLLFPVDRLESLDIDDESDFAIVERLVERRTDV